MDVHDDTTANSKQCTACGEVKPLEEFRKQSRRRDGRGTMCKICSNVASSAWAMANSERKRATDAAWRAANSERERARNAASYAASRERRLAGKAAWVAANRERARVSCYANNARRRARKAAAPVVERIYRAVVWERDGGRCHICGRKADPNNWHLEHIVPLASGGEHSYRNVAVSHPACNIRKGVRGAGQMRLALDIAATVARPDVGHLEAGR